MLEVLEGLTFDDVLLIPAFSDILPKEARLGTRLTREVSLNIPLVSAAMDTVTEARLAITIAQAGGLGIIHKNMPVERQASEVRSVKKYESGVIKDPITVSPDTTIREVLELTRTMQISGVPVVEGDELVVNAEVGGELRVELVDPTASQFDTGKKVHMSHYIGAAERKLDGFRREDCEVIRGDGLSHRVTWKGRSLASLRGKAVRLRFLFRDATVWAFQVADTGKSVR